MRKIALLLTDEQIAELETLARTTTHAQVRIRCLALLRLNGEAGYRAAARALDINESAVRKWCAAYRQSGVEGLQPRDRPGRPPKLTAMDRDVLAGALQSTPADHGLAGVVWTASLLNRYLRSRSDTRVTDWTIWAYIQGRRGEGVTRGDADSRAGCGHEDLTQPEARRKEETAMPESLSVWDPLRDLMSLRQAMDRLMDDRWFMQRQGMSGGANFLPLDVYITDDEVVVLASLPGMTADDVELIMQGDAVTIRGENKAPAGNVQWAMQERPYGRFTRTLHLNMPMNLSQAEASFENGVLTIRLPKAEAARPRQIQIKGKDGEAAAPPITPSE